MSAARAAMTEAIEIRVPGSPDPILAPNRRAHGFAKAEATKHLRRDAMMSVVAVVSESLFNPDLEPIALPISTGPVAISVLIRWGKGHRRHDLDSCAVMVKPAIDGIVDGGMLRNDSQIARLTIQQERDESGRGEVVITVTEMQP